MDGWMEVFHVEQLFCCPKSNCKLYLHSSINTIIVLHNVCSPPSPLRVDRAMIAPQTSPCVCVACQFMARTGGETVWLKANTKPYEKASKMTAGSRAERREGSVRRADLQVRQTCGKPPAQTCTFRAKFGPGNRENHTRTPERHRRRMLSSGPVRLEPLVGEFLVHRYIRFRFCVSVAVAVWAPPIVLKHWGNPLRWENERPHPLQPRRWWCFVSLWPKRQQQNSHQL